MITPIMFEPHDNTKSSLSNNDVKINLFLYKSCTSDADTYEPFILAATMREKERV